MSHNFKIQSTLHVGIIMDGNGRWALSRGLPRILGHRAGIESARRVIEAAPDHRVATLTLFAFSSDNWRRPQEEVDALMRLMEWYLDHETARCIENGVRIEVIGRRDRLSDGLRRSIEQCERMTATCAGMHLRIAIDYSSQYSILQAARRGAGDRHVGARRRNVRRQHGRSLRRRHGRTERGQRRRGDRRGRARGLGVAANHDGVHRIRLGALQYGVEDWHVLILIGS